MSLATRLEQLEPRERRLLNALVVVFTIVVVVAMPMGLRAVLLGQADHNLRLHEAIQAIRDERASLARRAAGAEEIAGRYARPAPELAGFLEGLAKRQNLQIPESQDRPPVPHGKNFEERSNRIVLRRVGLLDLAKFMESIAQSGHPVTVSEIEIRKRAPDAYDVTMVVSAFDRKQKPAAKATDGAEAESPDEETGDEEVTEP